MSDDIVVELRNIRVKIIRMQRRVKTPEERQSLGYIRLMIECALTKPPPDPSRNGDVHVLD